MTFLDVLVIVLWAAVGALLAGGLYVAVWWLVNDIRSARARHRAEREEGRKSLAAAYAQLLTIHNQQPEVDRLVAELRRYHTWIRENPEEFRAALRHWLGDEDQLQARRDLNHAVDQAIDLNRKDT